MPAGNALGARGRLTVVIAGVAAAAAIAGVVLACLAQSSPADGPAARVSQRDEQFHPGALAIRRDDTVRVVNDDGQVRHHAYVDSAGFKFDSGDQEPGQHSDIRFTVAGHFVVLCGIHPRMRLDVDVR